MKKQKVTIYCTGEFFGSVQSIEAYLIEHGRKQYAQYESAPFVVFIPKGKRKPRQILKGYKPYILIVDGWNNPQSSGLYDKPEIKNGVSIRKSQYPSFDSRYKSDFDAIIDSAENIKIIADYRDKNYL